MASKLQGSYTRKLRFAKELDFKDRPDIKTIYGDRTSMVAVIAERRLNFQVLGRVIRQRTMHSQPVQEILDSEQFVIRQRDGDRAKSA